jgi:hypothetical protein
MQKNVVTVSLSRIRRIGKAGAISPSLHLELKRLLENQIPIYWMMQRHYSSNKRKLQKLDELENLKFSVQRVVQSLKQQRIRAQLSGDMMLSKLRGKLYEDPQAIEMDAAEATDWVARVAEHLDRLNSTLAFGVSLLRRRPENSDENIARTAKPAMDHFTRMIALWWVRKVGPIEAAEKTKSNAAFTEIYRLIEGQKASRQNTRNRLRKLLSAKSGKLRPTS